MRPPPGFTLLEVLLALLIITIGLLGLAGTLGPVAALAGEGRIHGRIALIAASRLDLLRAGLLAGAPACAVPAAGVAVHPDGVVERWTARAGDGFIEVEVQAGLPGGRRGSVDTIRTRLSCP
jgi:prepilin-type N-terminal cleavage/methylation domain-containing protein